MLYIIFLFSFFLANSQSSNYWLQSAGSPNVDENLGIAKDNNNNLVSVGYFTNTITFPAGTHLTSAGIGTTDVLIQKTNTTGQVIWAVQAGGAGSDRGVSVACDAAGNIYVTGYYYGTAQFGTFTLNSVSNTQDVFIAKLSSSGTFLWAKSAGGPMAEDPYAIAVDNSNNVIVTGEFQGSSTFGSQTLTSTTNPYTGNFSFDVFTCKYDGSGNFLWVKQGAAHLDDRGIDVGTDASGNIFVCGQFSDTITFDVTHLNNIQNAVFIIKYNAAGQEQWLVRAGATSSIAYGLAVDNSNDVYVTGDYSGNLVFYGTPNNFLYGAYSNRIFLAKYSNNGNYLWGKEDASNSYVSAKDVALDANENPCIFGEFDCKMDDYSVLAGGTGMFNSIGFHDLFITQYDKNGNRQWARNFGGPLYDKAHGIVFANNSTPYVCGSFEKTLNVNTTYTPLSVLSHVPFTYAGWISSQNCTNNGSYYYGTLSEGFSDCFIMHGVDNASPYYDYYYRPTGGCGLDFVKGCIDDMTFNCQDTLKMCGPSNIIANPYTGSIGEVGPLYHYLWNTGDTTNYHYVTSSGNYSCVMTTIDGCFNTQDTVYAKVNPIPQPPTITDSYGINVNQPPATHSVEVCGGTVTLTGGNLQSCTYLWTSSSGVGIVSTSSASCVVNQTGWYIFTLTNIYGCTNYNQVYVQIDTLNHVAPKTNMPDTFRVCQGNCFNYFIYDIISNPTGQAYNCFSSLTNVITGNYQVSGFPYCVWSNLSLQICPNTTGILNLHIKYIFSSICGADTAYFNKSIYVIVNPNPQINISFTGSSFICPGDSTLLVATVTVTPSANVTYTISPNDSIWATIAGYYQVSVHAVDTLTGCSNSNYSGITVQTVSNPIVHTNPANGLICPHDSVELICNWPGMSSWQWHGPAGILPPNASSIYDSIPGFYYCVVTNSSGCVLTSNTVEIKQYNTPYLIALPQTVVCAGQLISLHVISNDTTLINWLPPLSGGGTTKTVASSGTYSCTVTMCGITTMCSMSVTVVQPIAQITAVGTTTICPGDSVILTANTGMTSYLWLPMDTFANSITAYNAGTYILVATDANGCQAKDSVIVTYNPNAPPIPTTTNDSICAGSQGHLQATTTTTNTIDWYAQAYSGSVINTGTNYTTPPLYANTTYYASVEDVSGCHSIRQPAYVFIKPTSVAPIIVATNPNLCLGDTLYLHANTVAGATYSWAGPNNFSSSQINPQIDSVTPAASGTYSLIISGSGCTSPIDTLSISVIKVNIPNIILTNDSVCQGSSLVISAQSSTPGVNYNWTGPNTYISSLQTFTITNVTNANAGTYTLQTNIGACKSPIDTIRVIVKSTPTPTINIQSNLCLGVSLILFAQTNSSASINWTGPAGFHSSIVMPIITHLTLSNTGYYYCYTTLNGCTGEDSAKATVNPLPNFSFGHDTTICASLPLVLYPGHFSYYMWNDTIPDSSYIVYSSQQVTLTVLNQYGCKYSDTINVTVAQCRLSSPNVFSPNGDGINDIYSFNISDYESLSFTIYDRWGTVIYKNASNQNSWNGIDINTKKIVDDGTYFYIVNCVNMLGVSAVDHGFIQVFR